jgi:hypothetical protein
MYTPFVKSILEDSRNEFECSHKALWSYSWPCDYHERANQPFPLGYQVVSDDNRRLQTKSFQLFPKTLLIEVL